MFSFNALYFVFIDLITCRSLYSYSYRYWVFERVESCGLFDTSGSSMFYSTCNNIVVKVWSIVSEVVSCCAAKPRRYFFQFSTSVVTYKELFSISTTALCYDYWLPVDLVVSSICVYISVFVSDIAQVGVKLRGISLFLKKVRYSKYC